MRNSIMAPACWFDCRFGCQTGYNDNASDIGMVRVACPRAGVAWRGGVSPIGCVSRRDRASRAVVRSTTTATSMATAERHLLRGVRSWSRPGRVEPALLWRRAGCGCRSGDPGREPARRCDRRCSRRRPCRCDLGRPGSRRSGRRLHVQWPILSGRPERSAPDASADVRSGRCRRARLTSSGISPRIIGASDGPRRAPFACAWLWRSLRAQPLAQLCRCRVAIARAIADDFYATSKIGQYGFGLMAKPILVLWLIDL